MAIATVEPSRAGSVPAVAGGAGWLDWGGAGPVLHFAHANGFPPGTYRRLLEALMRSFHVVSSEARPLASPDRPPEIDGWTPLADDLREELTARGLRGIVAVGHSLGAVTSLIAAADDPGLFAAVVAIDPVLITGARAVGWGLAKRLGLAGQLGLVRGARARREVWPDRRTARRAYASKRVFRSWRPEVLDDYVAAGFGELAEGGVRLRYPKLWEARIFEVAPHDVWPRLRGLATPVLFVKGERSDTFLGAACERALREVPGARVEVVAGAGHFLPMEQPERLAGVILDYLAGMDGGALEGENDESGA